jgi:hypothetical protein
LVTAVAKTAFEELDVYRLAEKLADEVWQVASAWPPFPRATIGVQAVRAADSIGANVAEGYGRAGARDNSRFIRIARGSLKRRLSGCEGLIAGGCWRNRPSAASQNCSRNLPRD